MLYNKGTFIMATSLISGVISYGRPGCPAVTDRCIGATSGNRPDHPRAAPCWQKKGNKWRCSEYAADGPAKCQSNEININTCFYNVKKPKCPKPTDVCSNYSTKHNATSPSTPPCWYHEKNSQDWQCFGTAHCKLERGMMDIRNCPGLKTNEY